MRSKRTFQFTKIPHVYMYKKKVDSLSIEHACMS